MTIKRNKRYKISVYYKYDVSLNKGTNKWKAVYWLKGRRSELFVADSLADVIYDCIFDHERFQDGVLIIENIKYGLDEDFNKEPEKNGKKDLYS